MRGILINLCRALLLAAMFWWSVAWFHWVSNFIGETYPWSLVRPIRWVGLVLEVFIIHAIVALPLVYPLAWIYRKASVAAAIFLMLPFAWLLSIDWQFQQHKLFFIALLAYKLICQAAFLVGGTVVARRHLLQMRRDTHPHTQTAA